MPSNRYRSNQSITNKVTNLDTKTKLLTKKRTTAATVASAPLAVEEVPNGLIGTTQIGVVSELTTDSPYLGLALPDGNYSYLGNPITDGPLPDLGTVDLDTVTTTGAYVQSTIVNGTLANHYPYASASGLLEVYNFLNGAHVYQRWTARGNGPSYVFVRGKYTTGAWQPWNMLDSSVSGWTSLNSYLATGITYVADGNSTLAGIRARRIGPYAEIHLANIQVDSIDVPIHGNIANRQLFTGIPEKFRPATMAIINAGPAGRLWTGYVDYNGNMFMSSVAPSSTFTATTAIANETYSGVAFYPVADPTLL